MIDPTSYLNQLNAEGNLRRIPTDDASGDMVDLSSNDYLGLAEDMSLREQFLAQIDASSLLMTSSASRLLAARQRAYTALEQLLASSYGADSALLFNSGYHANTGLVSAIGSMPSTLIVADKLVHASIIDGIKLSGATFERFRHNNYSHLERILAKQASRFSTILLIVESVYSMDGDRAPLRPLVELKRRYGNILLYVDEAHGVGVCGPAGLGCAAAEGIVGDIDILVGTMGKALASSGAYAIVNRTMREFIVNRARSLIFSTALPPAVAQWSMLTWRASLEGDSRREQLKKLAEQLALAIPGGAPSHIRPLIVGDASGTVTLSHTLAAQGFKVLPIRTPTVPPGTERLRFSLSANIQPEAITRLTETLRNINI